ncbi:MAG TPA: twin-arginine translocation signal domain-containing protein [Polyangiaceae bacterium]
MELGNLSRRTALQALGAGVATAGITWPGTASASTVRKPWHDLGLTASGSEPVFAYRNWSMLLARHSSGGVGATDYNLHTDSLGFMNDRGGGLVPGSIPVWDGGDAAARFGDGTLQVTTRYSNGSWMPWSNIGGSLRFKTDPCMIGSVWQGLAAQATNGTIWSNYGGSWRSLSSFTDTVSTMSAAVTGTRADLFHIASNGTLYRATYINGSWQYWWAEMYGSNGLQGTPSAVSIGDGKVRVLARGRDNSLWCRTLDLANPSNSTSLNLAETVWADPAAFSPQPGRIEVIFRGNYGIYQRRFNSGAWQHPAIYRGNTPWGVHGSTFTGCRPAVNRGLTPNLIEVFVRGANNRFWHLGLQD